MTHPSSEPVRAKLRSSSPGPDDVIQIRARPTPSTAAARARPLHPVGFIYLATARQARLAARAACRDSAVRHRDRARFWLAMARREPPPSLP